MRVALRTVPAAMSMTVSAPAEGVERHGRDGAEGALAWFAVAIGEVQVDSVIVDGDQRGAFHGLITGEIGECHMSNLRRVDTSGGNWTGAARVVLDG